jgi:DtxR family Mn-dependent transcriptional regulator
VRVSDSDPEMLRYLAERGISPGDRFEVRERQPFGGPLFVRFGEREHAIGGGSPARCAWSSSRRPGRRR